MKLVAGGSGECHAAAAWRSRADTISAGSPPIHLIDQQLQLTSDPDIVKFICVRCEVKVFFELFSLHDLRI